MRILGKAGKMGEIGESGKDVYKRQPINMAWSPWSAYTPMI